MAQNPCPTCGQPIPAVNINVAEGVALCAMCGKLARLSEIVELQEIQENSEAPAVVPRGCSTNVVMDEIRIRATLRSCAGMLGVLLIGLFWNGIVSVFVLQAVAGLYAHFVGPLPTWFPAAIGTQQALGELLFLCVFLIPFVLVGSMFVFGFLACAAGHVEVRIRGTAGAVRTGIGAFVWTKRFNPALVKRITIGETKWKQNDQTKPVICIEADRTVNFGSMLTEERREWMRATLVSMLLSPSKKN